MKSREDIRRRRQERMKELSAHGDRWVQSEQRKAHNAKLKEWRDDAYDNRLRDHRLSTNDNRLGEERLRNGRSNAFDERLMNELQREHRLSTNEERLINERLIDERPAQLKYEDRLKFDERLNDPEYVWKMKEKTFLWNSDETDQQTYEEERLSFRQWLVAPSRKQLAVKLILCFALFATVWTIAKVQAPWATPLQQYIQTALTRDMQFTSFAAWYVSNFQGSPSLIPAFLGGGNGNRNANNSRSEQLPASNDMRLYQPAAGKVLPSTKEDRVVFSYAQGTQSPIQGVTVQTKATEQVKALATGRVISVVRSPEPASTHTVIIQHAQQVQSIYGELAQTTVKKDDWIKGGATIGTVSHDQASDKGYFTFAATRGGRSLNIADVITFD